MAFDITQVDSLNNKIQQLNSERQRKIGLQQAAHQSYERAVFAYEQKWGVKVDDTNIQQEYNTVHEDLVNQYTNVSKMVTDIESGVYQQQVTPTLVENTAPIQTHTQTATTAVPSSPMQQQQQAFPQTAQQESEHRQVPTNLQAQAAMGAVQQQVPTTPQNAPQQAFSQVPTPTPVPFVQSPNPVGQQQLDPSEQSFAPEGWGTQPNINTTFEGINNGKPFGQ